MTLPIRTRLKSALKDGSKSDRLLASYMKDALAELPFETAASIAKKVKVSEATVGRFCRSIGYSNFRSLKDHLKHDMGDYPWLMSGRLRELQAGGGADERELNRGMELEVAAVVSVYEFARTPEWRRVTDRLAQCDRVFVAGFQTERGIAQYFANQMQYIRDRVTLVDLANGNFAEVLASEGESCLVIFEARRYSVLAKQLAQDARNAGIPVTLVTDVFCDWGREVADEVFAVPTQFNQFWDSTAQMASFANLLINSIFMKLGPEVEDRLKRIAKLYGRFTGHVGYPGGVAERQRNDRENKTEEEIQ